MQFQKGNEIFYSLIKLKNARELNGGSLCNEKINILEVFLSIHDIYERLCSPLW